MLLRSVYSDIVCFFRTLPVSRPAAPPPKFLPPPPHFPCPRNRKLSSSESTTQIKHCLQGFLFFVFFPSPPTPHPLNLHSHGDFRVPNASARQRIIFVQICLTAITAMQTRSKRSNIHLPPLGSAAKGTWLVSIANGSSSIIHYNRLSSLPRPSCPPDCIHTGTGRLALLPLTELSNPLHSTSNPRSSFFILPLPLMSSGSSCLLMCRRVPSLTPPPPFLPLTISF